MNLPVHVLLGALAGATIFLGLPVARWRSVSGNVRGLLALAAAGVILFLVVEVGFQSMQRVEAAFLGGGSALPLGLLLVAGFALGLVGLAWLEDHRRRRQAVGAGTLEVAMMVAIGIGLHNFAEGLAIGQSFSSGATSLGTVLVVGFALHNATEGFGIAGPLAGQSVSWPRLLSFGLIGGGPTAIGSLVGGLWVSPSLELLFLALATGSLVYVTRELFRIRFDRLRSSAAMAAVTVGLFLGFGTELIVDAGQAGLSASAMPASATVQFIDMNAEPESLSLSRGESLGIRNETNTTLIFEGNGLFVGEVAVPAQDSLTVITTGSVGEYRLVDERGTGGTARIQLLPGAAPDPFLEEKNALGALTVLEGHVRAARELRERGMRGEGSDPDGDLRRAPTHAAHPQKELLHGDQPDARALQALLSEYGLLEDLDGVLTEFVESAGDLSVDSGSFDQTYQGTLDMVERARRTIAGAQYDRPEFRADVIRFALETASGEYATATQGGHVTVGAIGVPGQDAYIEYQDARAFIMAAHELSSRSGVDLPPDARQAFDSLERNLFRTLDPPVPEAPVPPAAVQMLIQTVIDGLPSAA